MHLKVHAQTSDSSSRSPGGEGARGTLHLVNLSLQVQAILEGVIELRNENVDLVEIQGTVEEVTKDKARRAAEAVRQMLPHTVHSLIIF